MPVRFRKFLAPAPQAPSTVSLVEMPQIGRPIFSDEPVIVVPKPVSRVPAVAQGKPRVSLTMIVKNEECNLGGCLATVRDLVEEVVVVDTGSTDRTREIAKSFGAVLGEFPWIDHFAAARNAALERASGDYAFWMDADDRLDADNRVKLKTLFASLTGQNDAYVMKCWCVPDKPGAGSTVVDHVRLFRHVPQHRWTFRVHEQILPSLRSTGADIRWSDVVVQHVGYIDPKLRRRKLDRDLRLLKIDEAENPNSPFNLFNLGCVYRELGEHQAAVRVLEKSLSLSLPQDSIARKIYSTLAHSQAQTGEVNKAARTLHEGRSHYPDDPELLFMAGNLAKDRRQFQEAEQHYRQLIDGKEDGNHFASVDAGLRAVRGRHNLAVMLLEQGRFAEAEEVWRACLVADPHFLLAHLGLGDVYLNTGNAAGIAGVIETVRSLGVEGRAEAVAVEGRWRLRQKDHAGAAAILEAAVKEFPASVSLRITLSHVRLADGSPPEVLEAAFRAILELAPENTQARHNLSVLMRNTGRYIEGVINPPQS
jgi:tetratricopeptide (TPR) repeat protein